MLLIMSHVFLLLCILVIFDWMPDIVDLTLLGARYFCSLLNILEFWSWRQFDPVRPCFV